MNTRCPPKRVPSAARFFTLCELTVQPPQSYRFGGQRSSGQFTGKPAGARPDYRGRCCAVTETKESRSDRQGDQGEDYSSRGSLSCTYLCCRTTPAEGACLALTCVAGLLQQREPVLHLPVLQDYSSRGSLSCTYLCCRTTPAEGACLALTCVAGLLQQREPVLDLPVLQDYSSRGSLLYTYLCCRITPARGASSVFTCVIGLHQQKESIQESEEESWPCSYLWTDSLRRKESRYYSPVSTSPVASVVRSSGVGPI
ncbi:UNVERIFIED_CONTAM: hypothetical protein FKN15_039164 [Acipenser sinensis]